MVVAMMMMVVDQRGSPSSASFVRFEGSMITSPKAEVAGFLVGLEA
jgi:hypothetical protein